MVTQNGLRKIFQIIIPLLTGFVVFSESSQGATVDTPITPGMWRLSYYPSQFVSRYSVDSVPYHMYTHIVQMAILPTTNCTIDETSYNVKSGVYPVAPDHTRMIQLAHANNTKVLIMLFQGTTSTNIAKCTTPDKIDAFVSVVAAYVRNNGYDGLDLDWENGFEPSTLITQYQSLITKLRAQLAGLAFTVDIGLAMRNMVKPVQTQIDRINLMNYDMDGSDYNGISHGVAYHHSSLFKAQDGITRQSSEANIDYMTLSGIDLSRVNLGTAFYGWVLQGCQPTVLGGTICKTPIVSAIHLNDPITPLRTRKQVEYQEIETLFKNAGHFWDAVHGVPYLSFLASQNTACQDVRCKADSFVTYTNPEHVYLATKFAMKKKLGGVMTFALNHEFLSNLTGDDRYPLSRAMFSAMKTDSSKNMAIEKAARASCLASGQEGRTITFSLGSSENCSDACATLSPTVSAQCVKGWTEYRSFMHSYGSECTTRVTVASAHGKICCCYKPGIALPLQFGTTLNH